MRSLITHTGTFSIDDRIASPWHYLPVEVPAGTAALRVTLSYPRDPGAVLDLGCFDPAGFRGWSGGARDSFVVAEHGATPGYLAGPVTAGVWQLVIGLHAVPESGVPFTVTAEPLSAGAASLGAQLAAWLPVPELPGSVAVPVPGSRPARRSLPAEAGLTWLAGDLHAHTFHSDGVMSVAELAAHAVERGLDFVAVTDHNTVSHHAVLGPASSRYGVTLLPGQEVTTDLGHAGVLGEIGWVDFREPARRGCPLPSPGRADVGQPSVRRAGLVGAPDAQAAAAARGLALVLARPVVDDAAVLVAGVGPGRDPGRGQRLAPAGVRRAPWHADDLGLAARTRAWLGVLDGLRAGRVAISASRDGAVLLRDGDSLVAVGADGLVLAGPDGPYKRISGDLVPMPGAPGYHRLLTPTGATVALTP